MSTLVTSASLYSQFAAIFYLANRDLVNENMGVILKASDHCRSAARTCFIKIIDHVVNGNIALFEGEVPLYIWSDDCAAEFSSQFDF